MQNHRWTNARSVVLVCVLMLAAAKVEGATPEQNCGSARMLAWRTFVGCIEMAVANEAQGTLASPDGAFALCRHTYFQEWVKMQKPSRYHSLQGSPCLGSRFTDNGDGTVTDNLSLLVWEKKDDLAGIHDKDAAFGWSASGTAADGGVFTSFVPGVISASPPAAFGWRLPTFAQLQTIVLDYPCSGPRTNPVCVCPASPCIEPALDAAATAAAAYWSATSHVGTASNAWSVDFGAGGVGHADKASSFAVRAVRPK